MKQKLAVLFLSIIVTTGLSAQKTIFYKDENLWKESSEKHAKFKKTEFYKGDTLLIQTRRMSDELLLAESKWIQDKAVGVWTKYDSRGNLISSRDFSILVYSNDSIVGMYDNKTENEDCKDCEVASYPTGESGMFQFLGKTIRYPVEAIDMGNSGVVYIRFTIDQEGNVKPYSIVRGVGPFLDMEAWQIIEKMPKWNPATKNGEPIASYFTLPIRFSLR